MVDQVALNNNVHRDLRVITDRGAEYGENVHIIPVIADELPSLVLEYPACLMKNPDTGQFEMTALLGFEAGENLFLDDQGWNAVYIPIHVRRQPFLVGFSTDEKGQRGRGSGVIYIDQDSPRVQRDKGEALFDDNGNNTPFLDQVGNMLTGLIRGIESTKTFTEVLAEHDLIESAEVSITFANGEQRRYDGLYTINREKLNEMRGESLEMFHERGYLQACLLLMASMGNMAKLLRLKNLRLS
jgi:hypothetical protein